MLWTPTNFSTAKEDHAESTHGFCQWLEKWPHDLFLTNKMLADTRKALLGEPLRKSSSSLWRRHRKNCFSSSSCCYQIWMGPRKSYRHGAISPRTKPTLKMAQERGKGPGFLPDSSLLELAVVWDYQFPYYLSHLNQGFSVTCSPKFPNWNKNSWEKIKINRRLWCIGCYPKFFLLENQSHL